MNIQPQQNIHFKAQYLNTVKVKQQIPLTPFYKKVDAYLVKLESKEDIAQLTQFAVHHNNSGITYNILLNMKRSPDIYTTFALTSQKDGFQHLDGKKILGVCNGGFVLNDNKQKIFFIESLEAQSKRNKRAIHKEKEINILGKNFSIPIKHKSLGTAILKGIVKYLKNKPVEALELHSRKNSIPFYRHLGMEEFAPNDFSLGRENFDEFIAQK